MPDVSAKDRKVLLSFASRVDRKDSGALNNLGVLYFKRGLYREAMAEFKEALKIDPKFDLARENLQYLFAETGTEDPDLRRWQKEVDGKPENTEALLRLGISYQNMGRFKEASEILGRVVDSNTDHVVARLHLGGSLKAQGLYQQALEHYTSVRDEVGKSAVYHTDLGEIYYNLGRTDEAISELRTAIGLDADYWRSHFLLSFAYGDNSQLQEALEESRVASRLNPSFHNTEANLTLSKQGTAGTGVAGCGEIASLESTSFTLGTAYRERGFLKEALKEYQKALQDMLDKDRVYIEIGRIYISEGDFESAKKVFFKALEVNVDNGEAFRLLGCIYHVQGNYHQAAVCYVQAYRLSSVDADVLNSFGVLLYQTGLREEAERMFKKGLNLKLYNMELNYNFLTCQLVKEDYLMAENLIQRLEAFMGKSALLYEKRAILNYKLNRHTLALFDLESALSLNRNHADAFYLKGLIFLREEDFNGAIRAILDATRISTRYTGFSFFLSLEEHQRCEPLVVDPEMPSEPDDDLIKMLQFGIARKFDKMGEFNLTALESGIEKPKAKKEAVKARGKAKVERDDAIEGEAADTLEELRRELDL